MTAIRVATVAALAIAALHAAAVAASSVVPLDLRQIVARAEHIALVRCVGSDTRADPTVGIATTTTFEVLDRAKGAESATLTVRQAGGELNGLVVDFHTPQFRIGEEYVLFLPQVSRLGFASPVGLAQGAFSVKPGRNGKEVGNGRDFSELLTGVDGALIPPGIGVRMQEASDTRTQVDLQDFMALLRAKVRTP